MYSFRTKEWIEDLIELGNVTRDQIDRFLEASSERDFCESFDYLVEQSGADVEVWLRLIEGGESAEDVASFVSEFGPLLPHYEIIKELSNDIPNDVISYVIENFGADELCNLRSSILKQNCPSLEDYCLHMFIEIYQVPEKVARYLDASKIEQDYGDDLDLYRGYVFRV